MDGKLVSGTKFVLMLLFFSFFFPFFYPVKWEWDGVLNDWGFFFLLSFLFRPFDIGIHWLSMRAGGMLPLYMSFFGVVV